METAHIAGTLALVFLCAWQFVTSLFLCAWQCVTCPLVCMAMCDIPLADSIGVPLALQSPKTPWMLKQDAGCVSRLLFPSSYFAIHHCLQPYTRPTVRAVWVKPKSVRVLGVGKGAETIEGHLAGRACEHFWTHVNRYKRRKKKHWQ